VRAFSGSAVGISSRRTARVSRDFLQRNPQVEARVSTTYLTLIEDTDMKGNAFLIAMVAGLALAGCNKAESPAEVQHDVADARADAQRDVADAQADARENTADAQKDVADAQADHDPNDVADQTQQASETAAKNDYKVAVAQAEATHKVAMEKCESMSGDAQKDCKDRADRDLDAAKRAAEQRRDGSG
jgi:hypothetical protein